MYIDVEREFYSSVKKADFEKMRKNVRRVRKYAVNRALVELNRTVEGAEILIDGGADINYVMENHDCMTSALNEAFDAGNIDLAKYLISRGADVNCSTSWDGGGALLHRCKDVEFAEYLIKHGADVNCRCNDSYQTPLHTVCSVEMLELLIKNGADIRARDSEHLTAINYSSSLEIAQKLWFYGDNSVAPNALLHCEEDVELYQFLIEHGADVNCENEYGYSLFSLCKNYETAVFLIEHGAKVNQNNQCISRLLSSCNSVDAVKALIEHGVNINCIDDYGCTLIDGLYDCSLIEFYLKQGIDINHRNNDGETALMNVSDVEEARLLLKYGADVNLRDEYGNTALMGADVETTKELLAHGADLQARNEFGETALFKAPNFETAELLMDAGIDLDAKNDQGQTAIEIFVKCRHIEVEDRKRIILKWIEKGGQIQFDHYSLLFDCTDVKFAELLVKSGADPFVVNARGETVLFRVDNITLCRFYIELGVDVNVVDRFGKNALFDCKNVEIAQVLIEHGCNPKQRSVCGETPLFRLSWKSATAAQKLCDYLLDYVDINAVNATGETVLFEYAECCGYNTSKCFVELLKRGAKVNVCDLSGNTPLHLCRSVDSVKLLLKAGAEIDKKNNCGQTPLHTCYHSESGSGGFYYGDYYARDAAEELILSGANVNAVDDLGRTPLHLCKDADCAMLLIQKGADINARDCDGNTPLHLCKSVGVCRELMRAGADINIINNNAETPLMRCSDFAVLLTLWEAGARPLRVEGILSPAVYADRLGVYNLYLELGLKITNTDVNIHSRVDGNTPLHFAVMRDNINMVRVLIELGADVCAVNNIGLSPLNYVNYTNNGERIAELLILKGASKLSDLASVKVIAQMTKYYRACEMDYYRSKCRLLNDIIDIPKLNCYLNGEDSADNTSRTNLKYLESRLEFEEEGNIREVLFWDESGIVGGIAYNIVENIELILKNERYFEYYSEETQEKLRKSILGPVVYINNVYVRPAKRHLGYFRQMIQTLLGLLSDQSYILLRANSTLSNRIVEQPRLIELYQKSGFKIVQRYGRTALMAFGGEEE